MTKEKRYMHPVGWVYNTAIFLAGLLWRLMFHLKCDLTAINDLKAPFIAVCNHPSNMDGITAMLALKKHKVNVVVAEFYFCNRPLRWFFTKVGAISKTQFINDVKSIQSIMRVIRGGGSVLIFPGGQTSFAGISTYIHPGIAKLVKRLGVPVVDLHIEGSYFTFPKWCNTIRAGRVSLKAKILYTKEQLEKYSNQEVERGIESAVAYDEYAVQQRVKTRYSYGKKAKGLHTVLYICPKCRSEFAMRTKGDRLWCDHCGNTAILDEYSLLTKENDTSIIFRSPADWYRWQMSELKKQTSREDFELRSPMKLLLHNKLSAGYKFMGTGEAVLDRRGFSFKGIHRKSGEPLEFSIQSKNLPAIPSVPGYYIKISHPDGMYMLLPENGLHAIKWVLAQDIYTGTY